MQMDQQGKQSRRTRSLPLVSAMALCLSMGLISAASAAPDTKPCAGPCVTVPTTVADAVSSPEALRKAIAAIQFSGEALTPESKAAVTTLATLVKAAPPKFVLHASVDGEKGMEFNAAKAQKKARAAALSAALVEAGVPAANVSVTPR